MLSVAFTVFHKDFFFQSIQKLQTREIPLRAKPIAFSKATCLCNNCHNIKQHYNGTSCLKNNQKFLQYARNLYTLPFILQESMQSSIIGIIHIENEVNSVFFFMIFIE